MTTHRSLNKLERRSYMNIHNVAEVTDSEKPRETRTTRDRFGKVHGIPGGPAAKRGKMFTKPVLSVFLASFAFLSMSVPSLSAAEIRKGPNVTVDSSELELFGPAPEKESDRFVFYEDEKMVFGINDDAQADVGMPF
jgi:hypothetical protein